jgi:hypothetical protein
VRPWRLRDCLGLLIGDWDGNGLVLGWWTAQIWSHSSVTNNWNTATRRFYIGQSKCPDPVIHRTRSGRGIPARGVAPRSDTASILARRAFRSGRRARILLRESQGQGTCPTWTSTPRRCRGA